MVYVNVTCLTTHNDNATVLLFSKFLSLLPTALLAWLLSHVATR